MKKTFEIENKIIVVLNKYDAFVTVEVETFEEGYEIIKGEYVEAWDEEEWNEMEEFEFNKVKREFEENEYVEFLDCECITTKEYYVKNIMR